MLLYFYVGTVCDCYRLRTVTYSLSSRGHPLDLCFQNLPCYTRLKFTALPCFTYVFSYIYTECGDPKCLNAEKYSFKTHVITTMHRRTEQGNGITA